MEQGQDRRPESPVQAQRCPGTEGWVEELGLDPAGKGMCSMRRTNAALIYRRTKNLRAAQLLKSSFSLAAKHGFVYSSVVCFQVSIERSVEP